MIRRLLEGASVLTRLPLYLLGSLLFTAVMLALGTYSAWPTLVHSVAVPPLDVHFGLRELIAGSQSYFSFFFWLIIVLLVRSALLTWLLKGSDWQQFAATLKRVLVFYSCLLPFLLISAGLSFSSAATLYYGFFWLGVLLALLLVILCAPLPFVDFAWRRLSLRHFAASTTGALLLILIGVLAETNILIGIVASLAVTALTVWLLVRADTLIYVRYALSLVLTMGLGLLIYGAANDPIEPIRQDFAAEEQEGSLLLLAGIDSKTGTSAVFRIDPRQIGYSCTQTYYFSYAGTGLGTKDTSAACPITTGAVYDKRDTYRSLDELVDLLLEQLEPLEPPTTIVAHSQGVWVVHKALSQLEQGVVERVVYVGEFPDNWVGFPGAGEQAPGYVGRDVVRALTAVPRRAGISVFDLDLPLVEELLANPTKFKQVMDVPLPPNVSGLSITSIYDLPLIRNVEQAGFYTTCSYQVLHGNLPFARDFTRDVDTFFVGGEKTLNCGVLNRVIGDGFRPFGSPPNY